MTTTINGSGNHEIRLLSPEDMDVLIYLTSDIWITPEVKRFKNEILERIDKEIT